MIVNQIGQESKISLLTDIVQTRYPIFQDTETLDIWSTWKGMKNCFYVIDHCGKKLKKFHGWNKDGIEDKFDLAHEKREEDEECEECEEH